jgi:uncharacterized sporulation protein YeaH/YhbH (DUF444 family)
MSRFIDRRLNSKNKSMVNRQRLLHRYKKHIKNSVTEAMNKRSIADMDKGENVTIPIDDITEYQIHHGSGGIRETVYPGNDIFQSGDKIERPKSDSASQGSGAGNAQESGDDDFVFQLSREEFLDLYFDDLELPNLVKKQLTQIESYKYIRAGVSSVGVPNNINVIRSMKQALARRQAMRAPKRSELREKQDLLEKLLAEPIPNAQAISALEEEIAELTLRISRVPFIDDIDIRYNNRVKQSTPSTKAVMFCIMDVSGSMDEIKKDIAKRFFILLYLFLNRTYEKIELVFIRHHTSAKEVTEEEFFYSRETGGTVVSSALVNLRDILHERYPSGQWNVYVAQASDGDNWNADSPFCQQLLCESIMPYVQYYAYVEIMPRHHQSLWESYLHVKEKYNNFVMQNIDNRQDIYPIFREIFKR